MIIITITEIYSYSNELIVTYINNCFKSKMQVVTIVLLCILYCIPMYILFEMIVIDYMIRVDTNYLEIYNVCT